MLPNALPVVRIILPRPVKLESKDAVQSAQIGDPEPGLYRSATGLSRNPESGVPGDYELGRSWPIGSRSQSAGKPALSPSICLAVR